MPWVSLTQPWWRLVSKTPKSVLPLCCPRRPSETLHSCVAPGKPFSSIAFNSYLTSQAVFFQVSPLLHWLLGMTDFCSGPAQLRTATQSPSHTQVHLWGEAFNTTLFHHGIYLSPQQSLAFRATQFGKTLEVIISALIWTYPLFPLYSGFTFAVHFISQVSEQLFLQATNSPVTDIEVLSVRCGWGTKAQDLPFAPFHLGQHGAEEAWVWRKQHQANSSKFNKWDQAWNAVRKYTLTHPCLSSKASPVCG